MILPDLNLLLYAYNADAPQHEPARDWWASLVNGSEQVALAWPVISGFLRITTQHRMWPHPWAIGEACSRVRSWLERSHIAPLSPGPEHASILFRLLEGIGLGGNLTTDAHLAALAIEHQAQLHSSDADFARFPGLRWRNPLRR